VLGQFFQRDKVFKELVDEETDEGGASVGSAIRSAALLTRPAGRTQARR
jgi:hypothetical protein